MANLVLLHGLGANGRVWDTWPHSKHAPDLPGHGSAAPLSSYTFAAMAEAVAADLAVRRDVVLLGHSLGGVIALELASGRYDVTVRRVVALGVKVSWTADDLARASALAQKPSAWFATRDEAAARFLKVSGLQGLVDPAGAVVDHGLIEQEGRWRLAMDPGTFGVGAPDMPALIAASQADVVLARGERDPMNTDAELHALHHQVVTLPGLGHNAQVEDPDAVVALVR
ncbi:alpha/beta fold hydrolase [Kribbella shirazensis]|uniref:Pimeloyl-ACP methyl ester carboxylesterase n=1 Tax=Kribbella shirazensis TaxID=1105143 RepID=A0A7X5V882_9ACTN|nr:alpha/beta hydrolase [Kribbella shirazensis]NIK56056.1 pimeloyl-ACP methyl ester carboxylesterase [Kribbella shirazensis]